MKSYYDILEVSETATQQEIAKAYNKFVKKLHPDRNKDENDRKKFLEIQRAYSVLSDKTKRANYDSARKNPFFNSEDHSSSSNYSSQNFQNEEQFSSFADMFSQFFGGGGQDFFSGSSNFPNEAFIYQDVTAQVKLDFFEASIGAKKNVSYVQKSLCSCRQKSDKHISDYCGKCNRGWYSETVNISIDFPAALSETENFKVPGKGNIYGNRTSDLIIIVHSSLSFKEWKRIGCNIYKEIFLSHELAYNGGTIEVENIYKNMISVNIPAEIQSGDIIKLSSFGVKTKKFTGDFILTVLLYVAKGTTTKPRERKIFEVKK